MSFSDPTRTRPGPDMDPKNYGVFYGYFNYRAEPTRTRKEPTRTRTENYYVPIRSKYLGPERPGPEKNQSEPKIRTPRPKLNNTLTYLAHTDM